MGDFMAALAKAAGMNPHRAAEYLAPLMGQAREAAVKPTVVGKYRSDKEGWHDYTESNQVCKPEWQCSPEEMRDQLRRFAVPGQSPAKPIQDRQKYQVRDPWTGTHAGDVTSDISDDGMMVTNSTLPGHPLHDGQIQRRVWQAKDGSWWATTRGVGNNEIWGMDSVNELAGPEIFGAVDAQMRNNIRQHHNGRR